MSVYPYDPRYAQQPYPTAYPTTPVNPNGDFGNGMAGAATPGSMTNAANQQRSSDNVFTSILDHIQTFNGAMQPQPQPVTTMPVSKPFAPSAMSFKPSTMATPITDQPDAGIIGGGGGDIFGGTTPPTTGRTRAVSPTPAPSGVEGIGTGFGTAAPGGTLATTPTAPPAGSFVNPVPKPENPSDFEGLAAHYRGYAPLNPAFAKITGADVQMWQTLALGLDPNLGKLDPQYKDFATWYLAGKPMPSSGVNAITGINGAPPTAPGTTGGGQAGVGGAVTNAPDAALAARQAAMDANPNGTYVDPASTISQAGPPLTREQQLAALQTAPATPATPPAAATGAPTGTTPAGTTPAGTTPATGTTTPAAANPALTPPEEVQRMLDLLVQSKANNPQEPGIEALLNPMFARQRQKLADELRARGAATGATHAGRFEPNVVGGAVADLAGQQSAALAGQLGEEYLARLNQSTKLTELATTAGMQTFLANMNDDLERFKVNNGTDLQKWLANEDNVLKKYGIDQNVFVEKLKAELGLKGQEIGANATITAAQMHAAAAQAAAAASSGAQMYSADKNYQLGMNELGVKREAQIGNFILGLLGLGNAQFGNLNDIFGAFPSGGVFVKP